MHRGRLLIYLVPILLLFGTSLFGTASAAPHELPHNTPVVVVEDKTVESGCQFWMDGDVTSATACSPGSLLHSRSIP